MVINTWDDFFLSIKDKDYFKKIVSFVDKEYTSKVIYPPKDLMFNAFNRTPLDRVKVVVIGQDPYHEEHQAMGLAFSVFPDAKIPPSLINIYKEIDLEFNELSLTRDGDLTYLAEQGVLLLNTIFTVEEGKPLSHDIPEYKLFINDVFKCLESLEQPIVYLLWGGYAKKFKNLVTNKNHLVLEANHPSPLSANRGGWFGCNHFKLANEFLEKNNIEPIYWLNK